MGGGRVPIVGGDEVTATAMTIEQSRQGGSPRDAASTSRTSAASDAAKSTTTNRPARPPKEIVSLQPAKSTRDSAWELLVFRLAGERPRLPLEAAAEVTAVWRRALLSRADQPVAEAISGHAPGSTPESPQPSARSHLALLPLADVGHRLAACDLVGVAAALPGHLEPDARRACLRALERVRSLTLGRLGEWRLERNDAEDGRAALESRTWITPARVWASVTPVVLGRYPRKPWGEEAQQILREACTIADLPEPMDVETAPVGWVLGVPPASRFPPLPARAGKPRRFHVHARLVFAEAVAGPVLVGAGRHQGYGLLQQLGEGDE